MFLLFFRQSNEIVLLQFRELVAVARLLELLLRRLLFAEALAAVEVYRVVAVNLPVSIVKDGSPPIGDWLVHWFPFCSFGALVEGAISIEAAWCGNGLLLLDLRQWSVKLLARTESASRCATRTTYTWTPCALASERYALILGEEKNGLESHGLALESSIGYVVV